MEGVKKQLSLIVKGLKAPSESMGLNAPWRVFDRAKKRSLDWEPRFTNLK